MTGSEVWLNMSYVVQNIVHRNVSDHSGFCRKGNLRGYHTKEYIGELVQTAVGNPIYDIRTILKIRLKQHADW